MVHRQNLVIVNTLDKCTGGPITRSRTVGGKKEESCIDYIIVSEDLSQYLTNAMIDSNQLYALTKYTTTKGKHSVKRSDHYTLVANFAVRCCEKKQERIEMFKLRDESGLEKFNKITTKTTGLNRCMSSPELSLEEACNKWYKEFEKVLHQCFKKVRITETPPKNSLDFPIYQLMSENKKLKELLSTAATMCKKTIEWEIAHNDKKIAELQGHKCEETILEEAEKLNVNGEFNSNAAWKLKKKLFPKCSDAPFAVHDTNRQLVTDPKGILNVMKEEFVHRLRNRPIDDEYAELKELKEYLCKLRLEITKNADNSSWSMCQLEKAIHKLKRNKCKDPHGHINELYMYLGCEGLQSLLTLLNRIKEELLVPKNLKLSNVSTIYKGKGSRKDVINLRGIFKLPIVRNILDKLIHIEDQELICESMGPFQVGNQTERGIRDHTLIVHAVILDAKNRNIEIDIQFTDIKQCFDSVWLQDAINDLYHSGVKSRNLNIIFEGNRSTQMCVENKLCSSDRARLQNIVMQGSVSGGTLYSNQLSKLCNQTYTEGIVYMYGNRIPIPTLAMVDDLVSICICCATQSVEKNVKTDEFVKSKKLESQVGDGKCQWMHVGKEECPNSYYTANKKELSQCYIYKYLGDNVSDGWEPLYNKRVEKCKGYAATCLAMCTEMSLGFQMFTIIKMLHQAIFLNGTLTNMETWPMCNDNRITQFERVEQGMFRSILSAHSKTPIESLYFELGVIPFRFKLMARRILYYRTILNRKDDELTKMVISVQEDIGTQGGFFHQVQNDMEALDITKQQLITKSKLCLEDLVNKKVKEAAYAYLQNIARKHSKARHDIYKDLQGCGYFGDVRFSSEDTKLLFKFRTRMFAVRNNFRNKYACVLCPLCATTEDSQQHLFECEVMRIYHETQITYDDIFCDDNNTLLKAARELKKLVQIRSELVPDE